MTIAMLAAQPYPSKPTRVVVPFPAGGNIGADAVAKSAPDGYTLVMSAAKARGAGHLRVSMG